MLQKAAVKQWNKLYLKFFFEYERRYIITRITSRIPLDRVVTSNERNPFIERPEYRSFQPFLSYVRTECQQLSIYLRISIEYGK